MRLPVKATVSRWSRRAFLAVAGGALACGGDGSGPADSPRGGLADLVRISQGSDVLTLDPYFKNESPTLGVLINIFDPLTDVSPDLKIIPALAEAWEPVGSTAWEFRLRPGVRFHNGSTFDAEDVRYTILRARDWPPSRQKAEVATIGEVRIVDPLTVRFETTQPDAILPTKLISIYMLDKETCEAAVARHGEAWLSANAVGTGPYRLVEWRKDEHVLLEAFEGYWGPAPEVKRLRYLAISNDATRIANFLAGGVDLLSHVPVQDVARVEATPGFKVLRQPSLRLIYLGLDVGRDRSPGLPGSPPNPLKDPRVRRAIYAAIDEDLIVEKIMNGFAVPAGQLFPEGVVGYEPAIGREPFDLEKARRLMREAGHERGFDVRLDAPNDRYVNDEEIAQAVAQMLAKIGIRVRVNAQPKARFFPDEEAGEFSFFLIGWTNPNGDGYGTFDHLLHTLDPATNLGGANTSTHYTNAELDRLAEAASAEFDAGRREALLRQAVRIAMADLPHIPLHYQMDVYAVSDRIRWSPRRDTQLRGIDIGWAR